ncbi:MAG: PEGA domain-containing protein [Deltaproteobacteria bacterium]|nr:PEGA domain-containing protein [Deltaproteobacteria bacterium]
MTPDKIPRPTRHPWTLIAAFAFFFLLAVQGPARAISNADKQRAKKLFFQGIAASKAGQYPAALTYFQESFKLRPKSVVLFNIAMVHRALFQYKQSIAAFHHYVSMKGKRLRPGKKRRISNLIAEMEAKLAKLNLAVTPSGASVRLDGHILTYSPMGSPIPLDPGTHVLEISLQGYRVYSKTIHAVDGQQIALAVSLKRRRQKGFVVISSQAPGAMASIDGAMARPLPISTDLPEGVHQVQVSAPGYRPTSVAIVVRAGKMTRQDIALLPQSGTVVPPRPKARHHGTPRHRPRTRTTFTPTRTTSLPALAVSKSPTETHKAVPVYKKAWFWSVIGGAVLVVTGATLGGYYGWKASNKDNGPAVDYPIQLP